MSIVRARSAVLAGLLLGLLVGLVLAGLLAMHGLTGHGMAGAGMADDGSHATAAPAPGSAPAPAPGSAPAQLERAVELTETGSSSMGTMGSMAAMCLVLLVGALLLALRRTGWMARGLRGAWWRGATDAVRAAYARGADPPDLHRLGVLRC